MKRLLPLFLLIGACQPRTEMMIGIATDIRAPDILDAVQLNVTRVRDGFPEQQLPPWTISGLRNIPYNLPGSYGVYSPDGTETKIIVDLVGLKNDVPMVTRTAVLSLVNGKTLFLRMGLVVGCMGRTDCKANESCVEGKCVSQEINPLILPEFKDDLVTTLTCNSGTNFINTEDGTPMPLSDDALNCPGSMCGEGTCFHPPDNSDTMSGGGGKDASVGANDMGVPNGSAMCPGDMVGGSGIVLTDVADAVATDPANVFWASTSFGTITRSGPCGGSTDIVTGEAGGISGLAVAAGNIFWISGTSLRMAAVTGGAAQTVATISATNNAYVVSDGPNVFFSDTSNVYRVNAAPGQSPMVELMAVMPGTAGTGRNQIAVSGGTVAFYNGSNQLALHALGSGTSSFTPITIGISRGVVADPSGGVYFTDYNTGLNYIPKGGTVQNLVSPDQLKNTPGRLATDGTHLFVHTFSGTNDVLAEVDTKGTTTILANNATFASSTVQPALAAAQHGAYWIDSGGRLHRAPVVFP